MTSISPTHDEVLAALTVLRNTPKAALEAYRSEALAVALNIQRSLDTTSEILDKPPQVIATDLQKISPVQKCINSLQGSLDTTLKYLAQQPAKATGDPKWNTEDPRVIDVQFDKNLSQMKQFRRALGQRSLAKEFDAWTLKTYGHSKVEQLITDPAKSHQPAVSHMKEFVENRGFQDQKATMRGVQHGIKLLVLEKLLEEPAISAFLSFKFHIYRDINAYDIRPLSMAMRATPWLTKELKGKRDWFKACQDCYEDRNISTHNKRRRVNSSPTRLNDHAMLERGGGDTHDDNIDTLAGSALQFPATGPTTLSIAQEHTNHLSLPADTPSTEGHRTAAGVAQSLWSEQVANEVSNPPHYVIQQNLRGLMQDNFHDSATRVAHLETIIPAPYATNNGPQSEPSGILDTSIYAEPAGPHQQYNYGEMDTSLYAQLGDVEHDGLGLGSLGTSHYEQLDSVQHYGSTALDTSLCAQFYTPMDSSQISAGA